VSNTKLSSEPVAGLPANVVRRDSSKSAGRRLKAILTPFIGLAALLVVWALITAVFKIPEYLLPSPVIVAKRIVTDWPLLSRNFAYTLLEVVVGFCVSVLVGIPAAFLVVLSRPVERILMPIIVASQAVPKVAIAPLLVIWLGFGLLPKVVISFLIAFFPVLVSTSTGLRSVETDMIDLVRSMGASTMKIMFKVRLPTALPQIFSGLKVAISLSVVGALVGEFVGADRGLGYIMMTASGALDGTLVWATLIVLIFLGVVLFQIVAMIERFAIRWHVSVRQDKQNVTTS
jgi:NitT/TauT family transport system permease protein